MSGLFFTFRTKYLTTDTWEVHLSCTAWSSFLPGLRRENFKVLEKGAALHWGLLSAMANFNERMPYSRVEGMEHNNSAVRRNFRYNICEMQRSIRWIRRERSMYQAFSSIRYVVWNRIDLRRRRYLTWSSSIPITVEIVYVWLHPGFWLQRKEKLVHIWTQKYYVNDVRNIKKYFFKKSKNVSLPVTLKESLLKASGVLAESLKKFFAEQFRPLV